MKEIIGAFFALMYMKWHGFLSPSYSHSEEKSFIEKHENASVLSFAEPLIEPFRNVLKIDSLTAAVQR